MSIRDLLRQAARDGWSVTRTGGGHLLLTHPDVAMPVYTGSTPSDVRSTRNAAAMLKRALPKPPPIERRKVEKPKRRPKLAAAKLVTSSPAETRPTLSPRPQRRLAGGPPTRLARWWL